MLVWTSGCKNRSVHIREDFDRNKGEQGFDRTSLRFLYYTENSHEYKSSKSFNHHFIFITPTCTSLIMNRKQRSLTPYSQLRRAYTVNIASRADSGQYMASSRAPNSAVHWTHVKQRGRRVKPEVATVSLAWGVFGGDQSARIRTEQAIEPRGIPQDVDAKRERTWISRIHLTRTYNSLYLSPNSFSLRPFRASKFNQYRMHFFLSFLAVQCTNIRIFFFYLQI